MIVIYTSPGCASCRKVKNFLKDNNLNFKEKNIYNTLLNEKEVHYLISRTENGTDDLISKRSKIFQEQNIDFDSMSMNQLCRFIVNNPSILKRPIIIDDRDMQVGFNEDDIESFKKIKNLARCDKDCPHYEACGKIREGCD